MFAWCRLFGKFVSESSGCTSIPRRNLTGSLGTDEARHVVAAIDQRRGGGHRSRAANWNPALRARAISSGAWFASRFGSSFWT